jgi:arginine/lysine/ornithine decarboxylase
MGRGISPILTAEIGEAVFRMDLTEVIGLDDLHQPEGVIREAQELAAEAWGADRSFFLVNGTSAGIVAAIATTAKEGEKIIVPRNAHKSVVYGLIVSGAIPVYIQPEISSEHGLVGGFLPTELERIYSEHPDAKGVFSVSPTYHGIGSDTRALVEITHKFNGIFIADEAHGNHVYFHEDLPKGALDHGADISCQSTHKMSGSLGQSSMLHVKGDRVDIGRLRSNLQLMQSTSPSYLLQASLDVARSHMAINGRTIFGDLIPRIKETKERLRLIPGLEVLGDELIGNYGIAYYEPTRLVFTARSLGIEGYELFRRLRTDYGVELEFGDYYYGVAVLGPGTIQDDLDRLTVALQDIMNKAPNKASLVWKEKLPAMPPQRMTPRQAYHSKTESIPWEQAKGRISAELAVPYPPGIPVLCPGEEITSDVYDYLDGLKRSGRHLHGPEESNLSSIRVVTE